MNTNILQKCIAELKAEKPRIDYVLGMLETLYEMSEMYSVPDKYKLAPGVSTPMFQGDKGYPTAGSADEATLIDAPARAALATIKALADESVSQG